jgi:hypothetical protein
MEGTDHAGGAAGGLLPSQKAKERKRQQQNKNKLQ